MAKKNKIYAFVDESGQDTKGEIFIVSILVSDEEIGVLERELTAIEKESGKKMKWRKSSRQTRLDYLSRVVRVKSLKKKIYYDVFNYSKKNIEMTSYAAAKAILKKADSDYRATVYVDGLKRREMPIFIRGLRDLRIRTKKIRGVKKDENSVFIRLVDAVCGLARDAGEGQDWAIAILGEFYRKKIIEKL